VRRTRGLKASKQPARRSQGDFSRELDSYGRSHQPLSLSPPYDPWVDRYHDETPNYSYSQREESAGFTDDCDAHRNPPALWNRGRRARGRGNEIPPLPNRGDMRREPSYGYSLRRPSMSFREDSLLDCRQSYGRDSPPQKGLKSCRGSGSNCKRGHRGGNRGRPSLDRPQRDRLAASIEGPHPDTLRLPSRPSTPPRGAGHSFHGTGKRLSAEDGHKWSRDEEPRSRGRGKNRGRGRGRGGRGQKN
jgi:hypothetical protein